MKPTTDKPPCSATKSFLYVYVTAVHLILLYFTLNANVRIQTFNFPTTTNKHHRYNNNTNAAPPTSAPSTDRLILLPPTNVSHLLFAIAGSASTWKERSEYGSVWWRPGVTRGHVWLDTEPSSASDSTWLHSLLSGTAAIPPYKISDPKWKKFLFAFSSSESAVRIARILLESFELGLPDVRWFVLGDDDTVFFPENLATVLGKYDHREMYYVGGNSESVEQNELHSYDMAFGGGGFAISYSLAVDLVRILDGCLDRFFYFYGSDERICACIAELGISLTIEHGFHQLDVRANPYGLLAAHPLAPLLSLHHLDAVESMFPPPKSQMESIKSIFEAYEVDPGRILQRSFCYDHSRNWTLSVSWGYTVQLWPKIIHLHDMLPALQTFKTWRWSDGPFTFNARGVSPDACEQPIVFYLDIVKAKQNESVSSYKKEPMTTGQTSICERPDYLMASNMSEISLSAETMQMADWQKTARRQCCEIVDGGHEKYTMKLKLRKCQRGETISN